MTREAAYIIGLVATSAVAIVSARRFGTGGLSRSMAIIILNWCAGIAWNIATGDHHAWMFNIIIDSSASVAIVRRPAGKVQALLVVSYCVQIAMHVGYGVAKWMGSVDPDKYNGALTAVAWAQLAIMGGWCGGVWYYHLRRSRDYHNPSPIAPRYSGVAEP